MRNRQDLGLETVPGSVLRLRKRIVAILTLNCLLFGVLAFVSGPRILEPIMSIPPNRYFQPTEGMLCVANIAGVYRTAAWLFFGFAVALGWVSLQGWLDRMNRPFLILLICSCISAIACIVYSETL